jgi:GNAT superfamily N-acetyltransferase
MHRQAGRLSENCAGNAIFITSMKHDISIRPAQGSDLLALIDNNQAMAWETEARRLPEEILSKGVAALLHDPNKGFYLIAEIDGVIAGSLMVTSEWSDWRNGDMWWFQSVFVRPDFRGMGVFKALFQHVAKMAKEQEVRELRLYVERDNERAQKVYRALGMEHSHYDMWEMVV